MPEPGPRHPPRGLPERLIGGVTSLFDGLQGVWESPRTEHAMGAALVVVFVVAMEVIELGAAALGIAISLAYDFHTPGPHEAGTAGGAAGRD